MNLREHIPLAPLTTLGVGGPARYFVEATSAEEVCAAVDFARLRQLPLFVLGGGSNLLVADAGFSGLVIKIAIQQVADGSPAGIFTIGAGVAWDEFVARAIASGCAGVECLSGIPGTVGGAPVQNIGAYGQEVSETIREVEVFDLESGLARTFRNDECNFGYRSSRFNSSEPGRYIILAVTFALRPGGGPNISYGDLANAFRGRAPTLATVCQEVLRIRRSKGMLLVPDDEDCRSAGSFFKNPVLNAAQHAELCARAAGRGLSVPSYPALASQHKVAAAWLVEQSGFHKGYSRGAVGISRKHALAIVNRGGATASEIVSLKNDIQRTVFDHFGIELQPEPVFVGFDNL